MRRRVHAMLLALSAVLGIPLPAVHAQSVLDTVGAYQGLAFPEAAERSGSPREMLRRLSPPPGGWKVDGETGALTTQVYLTAADAASVARFRLAYESAASVLPDLSRIAVSINGVEIGASSIAAPAEVTPIELAIPAGLLLHGFNAVSISLEQRHRVDCSPEATYELWTRIDPLGTGLLVQGRTGLGEVADLAAVAPDASGAVVITVPLAGRLTPERVDQVNQATSAIALLGRYVRPLVRFEATPATSSGVNLVVTTAAEARDLLQSLGEPSEVTGPALILSKVRAGGAPTLVVTGRNDRELNEAIARLAALGPPESSVPAAPRISGGERLRLADLGIARREFSGRVFRLAIPIELPADLLVADYGRLSVSLSGAYAPGLLAGAQVQIDLNGQESASVQLSDPAGGPFRANDIFVPLGALRPGRNLLEIRATLPKASDSTCEQAKSLAEEAPRFLLSDDTEIRFPRLARVARTPDLALTMAGGYPYAAARPKLFVPNPDRESLSAALTMTARLSQAAGRPLPFSLVIANPGDRPEPALLVTPAPSLDPAMMRAIGLDPDAVRRAWDRNGAPPVVAKVVSSDRLSPMLDRRPLFDRARDLVQTIAAKSADATGLVRRLVGGQAPSLAIDPDAALILAQGYPAGDNLLTVVTAPDRDSLRRAVEALVAPTAWARPRGAISVLGHSAQLLATVDADRQRLVPTQEFSLGNARLIFAGWLSLHPALYAIAALLLAILLGATAQALVKQVGRRTP